MDESEPNLSPVFHDEIEPIQSTQTIKAESKLIRTLKNISPFTYSCILVLTISLVALTYFIIQNLSLKNQLGISSFRWPWTNAFCTYQGTEFKPGESVPAVDGCNSCSCDESGQVMCTLMACKTPELIVQESVDNHVPVDLTSLYSFKLPQEVSFIHFKTGMSENDEGYNSSKYPSLKILLEQGWRNGFGCDILIASEAITIDGRLVTKEVWKGIPSDYPDSDAAVLCDSSSSIGFRGIVIELKKPTDVSWGHSFILMHNTHELSEKIADEILNQILSTFKFID